MYREGRWLLVIALLMVWAYGYWRHLDMLTAILLVFSAFYFTTNALGVQYLLWILPFALLSRDRLTLSYTCVVTILLGLAYLLGPSVYVPPPIPWPPMPVGAREFVVKLASIPVWMLCGWWVLRLVRGLCLPSESKQ